MTTTYVWSGAPTDTSVWLRGKIIGVEARLAVSTQSSLANPIFYGPDTATADGIVSIVATGLEPQTRYWYALEIDGDLDGDVVGTVITSPVVGEPGDFTLAAWSCQGQSPEFPAVDEPPALAPNRISNTPHFTDPLAHNPDLIVQIGDLTYYDPGSGVHVPDASVATFRTMYDDQFNQPNWAQLTRGAALIHQGDDHEGGPNNHDGTFVDLPNYLQVYREREPHYPLSVPSNQFQAFKYARAQVVVWDVRSNRDPNGDPQGPGKTMLGTGQRNAFAEVLQTSSAEVLIIFSPSVWHYPAGGLVDSWSSYADEQQWVIDRLVQYGWSGKTVIIQGDRHGAGIDTGAQTPGGIPTMQAASMDSIPESQGHFDLGPSSAQRGQYGTVSVADTDTQIAVTMTTWTGLTSTYTHTIIVTPAPPPPPPPIPAPAPVGVGVIRRGVTWLSIDDATGRVGHQLDDFTGQTSRLLMAYSSQKLTYPLTGSGPGGIPVEVLRQATEPQRSSIIQVVNDLPMWGGRVLIQDGGSAPTLSLATATFEQYLLQRRVTTRSYVNIDRASIAADLLTDAGSTDLGPGMALELDVELTGDLIDASYLASDQMTVYAALRDLCAAGTMEWTIDLDWVDARMNGVRRILRIRRRIGRQIITDRAQFETTGLADCRYQLIRDFSSVRYANHVTVYGDGEGEDMPRSEPTIDTVALASGMPIVEAVIHARDTTDPAELNRRAAAQLAIMMHGSELWELDAVIDAYPRPGFDAGLGDQVSWGLTSPWHPSGDGVSPGVQGQGRMIGYGGFDAVSGRWKPQLLDPHEELV